MESAFIAIGAFVPMLVLLVVIHEWGHFFTARAFGVKVLEFGIGYPPRAFGIYTGRTRILLHPRTRYIGIDGDVPQPGQIVRVISCEDEDGNLMALAMEGNLSGGWRRQSVLQELGDGEYLRHDGRVREVGEDSLVLADMLYSVNWLPLGGFVRLAGENNPQAPQSLAARSPGVRAIVLAAGSLMNAAFPIVAFALMAMIPHSVVLGNVAVTAVADDSPAQAAGIRAGDLVLAAGGRTVTESSDLLRAIALDAGSEMEWLVERNGRTEVVRLTPRVDPPAGQGATGIQIELVNQRTETRYAPPWTAVGRGFTDTWDVLVLLRREISAWITGDRAPQLSGPVGIAQVTGQVTQEGGVRGWMVLAILLSINLAILNLLPIPMLDGGRLVFVALEWVRGGKRIPPNREGVVHLIGFLALIGLIVFITYNDIVRIIQGVPLGG